MTDAEANLLEPGLYRLRWSAGGTSLAAVGVLANGDRWFAPTNWLNFGLHGRFPDEAGDVGATAWGVVASAEALEPVSKKDYAEMLGVFGDRVQDSDVARLAVARENEACAAICDAVQRAADARHAASADPGEGSDGAGQAAEEIRARMTR